jgi:hypothetical protein
LNASIICDVPTDDLCDSHVGCASITGVGDVRRSNGLK